MFINNFFLNLPSLRRRPSPVDPTEAPNDDRFNQMPDIGRLVPAAEATHLSTGTGNWASGATWSTGTVPGAGDRVLILAGHTVTYNQNSTARIKWVRVDGTFTADRTESVTRRLFVDTMIGSMGSTIDLGTVASPIPSTSTLEINIADNGNIDLNYDPKLLSRGIIPMGAWTAHGAAKSSFHRLNGAVSAGASTITLEEVPSNWVAGDKILVVGDNVPGRYGGGWDYFDNWVRYAGTNDEIHEIDSIDGATITLVGSITNARNGQTVTDSGGVVNAKWGRTTFYAHVANLTHNVKLQTENIAGDFPVHRRGHFMVMGSMSSADMRYVEVYGFGRTDKRGPSLLPSDTPTDPTQSVVGRYALHCHFMGTNRTKQKNPPTFVRNSIWGPDVVEASGKRREFAGSPGWGLVQHGSGANWYQNVAYGCLGAAFIAEDGTETGTWNENIGVKSCGFDFTTNIKNQKQFDANDSGFGGHALFSVGRMVRAKGNIGASSQYGGTIFLRSGISITVDDWQIPEAIIGPNGSSITAGNNIPPVNHWDNNEFYGVRGVIDVTKSNPKQLHTYFSLFEGVLGWNIRSNTGSGAAEFQYTGHYTIKDLHLIGSSSSSFGKSQQDQAIRLAGFTVSFNFIRPYMENWGAGILFTGNTAGVNSAITELTDWDRRVVAPAYVNVDTPSVFEPSYDATFTTNDTVYATEGDIANNAFAWIGSTTLTDTNTSAGATLGSGYLITDSIDQYGINTWEKGANPGNKFSTEGIDYFLGENGYWQDGATNILFAPWWITDRLTGEHKVIMFRINLNAGRSLTGTNRGAWTAGSAPVRAAIAVSTSEATPITIDVTSAATDADGDTVRLLGNDRTSNAECITQDDGTIYYRPDFGFTGTDTFRAWIDDYRGNVTPVEITVTVS